MLGQVDGSEARGISPACRSSGTVSSTAKSSGPAPSPATVEIESNTSLIAKIAENEQPALQYQDKKCLLRIIVAKFGVYISSNKKNSENVGNGARQSALHTCRQGDTRHSLNKL